MSIKLLFFKEYPIFCGNIPNRLELTQNLQHEHDSETGNYGEQLPNAAVMIASFAGEHLEEDDVQESAGRHPLQHHGRDVFLAPFRLTEDQTDADA